jgi:hypothetical protein
MESSWQDLNVWSEQLYHDPLASTVGGATQSAEEALPLFGDALPAAQLLQVVRAPGAEANVPRGQGVQSLLTQRHFWALVQGAVLLLSSLK